MVELALAASHSKASWDRARFGPQASKELETGPAKPSRVPQTHMCLSLPSTPHILTTSDLCSHLPVYLCPASLLLTSHYLLVFLGVIIKMPNNPVQQDTDPSEWTRTLAWVLEIACLVDIKLLVMGGWKRRRAGAGAALGVRQRLRATALYSWYRSIFTFGQGE